MKLKICGMRDRANIQGLGQLEIDFIGLIFYEKSQRFVANEEELNPLNLPYSIKKVGVFVNAGIDYILEKVNQFGLDYAQLHGEESFDFCKSLKEKGIGVIKVFSVSGELPENLISQYEPVVNFFLFDTKTSKYGGSGVKFNWDLLNDYSFETPYFLSGGINAKDIHDIIKKNLPGLFAIDVNSGVEIGPGIKDLKKVKLITEVIKKVSKMNEHSKYTVDERGYYGNFGGAYIPEMLQPNMEELQTEYLKIITEQAFQNEFHKLLKDYVGRPTPLYLAERLSEKYDANIYLKREDLCHTGAHKINNTIGQIILAKRLKKTKIIAETGAGQHGVATATVCALAGIKCIVYMGKVDMERQRPNVERMRISGAEVRPATSGSQTLKDATNEALRHWINDPWDTHYIIGSVVGPHPYPDMVARFQSVISKEIKWQLIEHTGRENPDFVMACVGGGSNAMGAFYHYLDERGVKLIAVEAAGKGVNSGKSAATTQLGKEGILHGSRSLVMQTEDGQVIEPHSISAGLDYPGIGPIHAHLFQSKRAQFLNVTDEEAMKAGIQLSRLEGIIPAIESAHALAALEQLQFNLNDNVVLNLSGRGDKDLETYIKWGNY